MVILLLLFWQRPESHMPPTLLLKNHFFKEKGVCTFHRSILHLFSTVSSFLSFLSRLTLFVKPHCTQISGVGGRHSHTLLHPTNYKSNSFTSASLCSALGLLCRGAVRALRRRSARRLSPSSSSWWVS
jgi:hypothetical protein